MVAIHAMGESLELFLSAVHMVSNFHLIKLANLSLTGPVECQRGQFQRVRAARASVAVFQAILCEPAASSGWRASRRNYFQEEPCTILAVLLLLDNFHPSRNYLAT